MHRTIRGKKKKKKKSKSFWISIRQGKIRVRMHGTIPKENSKTSQKTKKVTHTSSEFVSLSLAFRIGNLNNPELTLVDWQSADWSTMNIEMS